MNKREIGNREQGIGTGAKVQSSMFKVQSSKFKVQRITNKLWD
jgi:hypothetical protein